MPLKQHMRHTLLQELQCMMGTSTMTILKYWLRRGFGHEQTMTSVLDSERSTLRLAITGRNSLPPCYKLNANTNHSHFSFWQLLYNMLPSLAYCQTVYNDTT